MQTDFIVKPAINYSRALHIASIALTGTNGIVAGGCFKNFFNGDKPRDIDIFFRNVEDFNKAVDFYRNKLNRNELYATDNVIAFELVVQGNKYTVELVRKQFYQNPEMLLDTIDFTICKIALYNVEIVCNDSETVITQEVMFYKDFFEHLQRKMCILVNTPRQDLLLATFNRMLKYVRYGYTPCIDTKKILINGIAQLARSTDEELDISGNVFYENLD